VSFYEAWVKYFQNAKVDNYLVRAISGVVDLDYYLKKS